MKNIRKILQYVIGMNRKIVVIITFFGVTFVNIFVFKCSEIRIGFVFFPEG